MSRVLVVEDEPAIALGLEDDLKLEGYEVVVTGNGVDAIRHAREQRFDLIVLDVMVQGATGSTCAANCGGPAYERRS